MLLMSLIYNMLLYLLEVPDRNMKMTVYRYVTSFSLEEVDRLYRGTCCLHRHNLYENMQLSIPELCHLIIFHRENLKSHRKIIIIYHLL